MQNTSHPLHAKLLHGKRVVLGVTGGIAIVKSLELARVLTKAGATVHTVMTHSAKKMIAPEVFTALTGEKTWVDQWQEDAAGMMAHIALSRSADCILIAPATANVMAKLAGGVADDLLTTLVLGREKSCALMIAPAMNVEMWEEKATQKNLAILEKNQATIFPPESGLLACGEEGAGRLMPVDDLIWHCLRSLQRKAGNALLENKKVLITLGSTLEMIDPVRGITNISSGKMGLALAQCAWLMGAELSVVAGGNVSSFLSMPSEQLHWQNTGNAQEMHDAVMEQIHKAIFEAMIAVAAVADYRPEAYRAQKVKKQADQIDITLTKNPDIVRTVAGLKEHRPKTIIGFAAESEKVQEHARQKLLDKNLDAIVANDVAKAFGNTTNQGLLVFAKSPDHPISLPSQEKALMAWDILSAAFSSDKTIT